MLHDSNVLASVQARLNKLRPDSKPIWGRMTPDQMLWHLNQALGASLGRITAQMEPSPMPRPLFRFLVLNLPWPKNTPTNKEWVARERHDFETELARCRALVADFAARPLEQRPAEHPMFGNMSCRQQSRLHAKHLNHHLRQFGL